MSSPGRTWLPTSASPNSDSKATTRPDRRSSVGVSAGVSVSTSANDDRLPTPARRHVFVQDALLQEHDPFEQSLGPRRASRDVHVNRYHLVDTLGDRVAVPV